MSHHEIMVHEVDYLAATKGKAGPNERPIVIITIRPDEGSFRPHNVGIARSQAERLLEDLKGILSRSGQ